MDAPNPLTPDLLLQHESFVLRLARGLVRDDATARDVAQETMLSALRTPPQPSALRGWLARVVKHRAADTRTRSRRRERREELVARPEAVDAAASASERLELQHGVVTAVLALDEPYRGVVIATYFEGLTPNELAARRGVPAATVRSQLTRALEQLRIKLDREHGDRRAWSVALLGMLELRATDATSASATVAAGTSSSASALMPWLVAGSVAFVATIAFVAWPKSESVTPGAFASNVAALVTNEPELSNEPPSSEATRIMAASAVVASSTATSLPFEDATLADVPAILERQRQAKQLYHTRWMKVSDADLESFAWLGAGDDGGVTRLRDRNADAEDLSLPWMRFGGAYFSFSDRVHDYNRRPQIELQGGALNASFAGISDHLILDLGAIELRNVPTKVRSLPPGLDPLGVLVWQTMWRPLSERAWTERQNVHAMLRERVDEELNEGRIDQAAWEELIHRRNLRCPQAIDGHVYLVRTMSSDEFDVLAALQVLHVDDEGCTFAWRLLESWPVPKPSRPWTPRMTADQLPPPPADLAAMGQSELLAEIDRLGTLSDRTLFQRFTPEIESRFGALRQQSDSGLVRLIGYLGPWSEASKDRRGGGIYSFGERSHAGPNYELNVQGTRDGWNFSAAVAGYDCSALLDLGAIDFERADANTIARTAGDVGAFVVEREFARRAEELSTKDPSHAKVFQERVSFESAASTAFKAQLRQLGASERAPVALGHTYALRAVHFGEKDLLVLVHVADVDEYGVVLAYRILRELPLDSPRH